MPFGPRIALCPGRGGLFTQGLVFATGRCWRERVLVLCSSGFGGWAAGAGLPLGLVVRGRPLLGPLASRIAVAFPRPGPHEAQCFLIPLQRDRLLHVTFVLELVADGNNGSWFQKPWSPKRVIPPQPLHSIEKNDGCARWGPTAAQPRSRPVCPDQIAHPQ
ncbi:hypothetical protein F5883DRAFT_46536 [Diaporthe sp. PMI_573]|nr:hypothetical protein F5883DRAFT_46536 [Diaporthaceae sp. PMI_573]